MVSLQDCFGNIVTLTSERLLHILEHPEMHGMEAENARLCMMRQASRKSVSDASVNLFYRFYARTVLNGKWLCVVVKYREADAFVVTAYLTNEPKPGEELWLRE